MNPLPPHRAAPGAFGFCSASRRGGDRPACAWLLAAASLACASACGASATVEDDEPRVVLGTGADGYQAIDESVPLISGIQGGFHVWTSFLAYGFETDVLQMELSTRFEGEEGSRVSHPGRVALRPTQDERGREAVGV